MSLFVKAANLNNDGINGLLQGDHETAMHSLSNAIKLMKEAINQYQMAETMNDGNGSDNGILSVGRDINHTGIEDVVPSLSSDASTSNPSSRTSTSSNDDNIFGNTPISPHQYHHTVEIPIRSSESSFDYDITTTSEIRIFNQAIQIPVPSSTTTSTTNSNHTDNTRRQPRSGLDLSVCVGIIIFNSALVYHIKAYSFSSLVFQQRQSSANKTRNTTTNPITTVTATTATATATANVTTTILGDDDDNDRNIIMRKQAICIAKAKNLYTMALKLLNGNTSYSMNDDYHHSQAALVVKLASINNLLQIRYFSSNDNHHKNKEEGSSDSGSSSGSSSSSSSHSNSNDDILEQGLSQVSSFFRDSPSILAHQHSRAMLEDTKIQTLLMNIFLFKNFPVIAAAAA